jgi:Tfp pilus assembly protein PilV
VSTNWEAVRSGDLDALGAAIFDKMAGQKDDPSSVAQEMADAALALIERCKAEQARRETAERRVHEEVSGRQAAETSLARAQQQATDADEGAASWMRRADSARHRAEQAETSLSAALRRAGEAEARSKSFEEQLHSEMGMRDFEHACCASDAPPHATCCNEEDTRECRRCLTARAEALEKAALALIASEFCRTGAGDPMVGAAEFESLRALTGGDAADERSGT